MVNNEERNEMIANKVENGSVGLDMDFALRLLLVMEQAQEVLPEGEQKAYMSEYTNTIYQTIREEMSEEEIETAVEENFISEL